MDPTHKSDQNGDVHDMTFTVEGNDVKIELWEPFHGPTSQEPTQTFYKGMHVLVVVYAKDNEDSFNEVTHLITKAFED